jgi:hypothetical protein
MIELVEKGHAYESKASFFSVKSFLPGQLSRCNHDEMMAGTRGGGSLQKGCGRFHSLETLS